jgi:hypothetical protein
MWSPSQQRTFVLCALEKRDLAMLDRISIVLFLISWLRGGILLRVMELVEDPFTTALSETLRTRIFLSSTLDQGKIVSLSFHA